MVDVTQRCAINSRSDMFNYEIVKYGLCIIYFSLVITIDRFYCFDNFDKEE